MSATLVATGCGWFGTGKALHRVGPQPRYSEIWSADPGIDLFDRGAELVRAAVDAATYTRFAGFDQTFPGYEEATESERSRLLSYVDWSLADSPKRALGWPRTDFNHIAGLSFSESSVSATVCSYVIFESAGVLARPGPEVIGINVRMSNPADNIGKTGSPDRRPEVADSLGRYVPDWNVFGSWRIDELRHEYDRLPEGCARWFQALYPSAVRPSPRTMSPPLGTLPPTMPVGIQYPEWIGPSDG